MFADWFKTILKIPQNLTVLTTLSLVASFAIVMGFQVSILKNISLAHSLLIVPIFLVLFLVLSLTWILLDRINCHKIAPPSHPLRASLIAYTVIVTCWVPILLAGYPGFFTYDAGYGWLMQWEQIESGVLNAHHPIIHTLFLEYTIKLGIVLFGSFNAGIALSVFIQAIIVASLLVYSLFLCLKQGMGKLGFCLSIGFYALNPIVSMFAFCTTKDVFCATLLVAYCTGLAYRFGFRRTNITKRENIIWMLFLITTLFLIGVLRSNALVAIFIFTPLLALVATKKDRKYLISSSVISIVLCALFLGPVSSLMHIQESPIGKWNALCIAEQQIARCAYSGNVTETDKEHINELLPNINYKENLSDIARGAFMSNNASGTELVSLYIQLGIKYPKEYLAAFLYQTEDAWSPFSVIDCYQGANSKWSDVFSFKTVAPGEQDSKLPQLASILGWISVDANFQHSPLGIIASIPLCLFMTLFLLLRSIALKQKAALYFVAPLAIMSLSNLLGPCVLIRYYLYLFYAFPIMVFMLPGTERPALKIRNKA